MKMKTIMESWQKFNESDLEDEDELQLRYDFERDEQAAEQVIAQLGLQNFTAKYVEGYNDEHAARSLQDFSDYVTDMTTSGRIDVFLDVTFDEPSPVVGKNHYKRIISPTIRKTSEEFDTAAPDMGFGAFVEFLSTNKRDPKRLSGEQIVGARIELQSVSYEAGDETDEYFVEQLQFYKECDAKAQHFIDIVKKNFSQMSALLGGKNKKEM
jgi:hypothetical protein